MAVCPRLAWLLATFFLAAVAGLRIDVLRGGDAAGCCTTSCCGTPETTSCCEKPADGPMLVDSCTCGKGRLVAVDGPLTLGLPATEAVPGTSLRGGGWDLPPSRRPASCEPAPEAPPPWVTRA